MKGKAMRDAKDAVAKLEAVIEKIDRLAILIAQIDPDAKGAALLLKKIVEGKFKKPTKIYYCGAANHPQNKAIWNVFNLDEVIEPIAKYEKQPIALVDSSSAKDGRFGLKGEIDPQNIRIVIDHHRGSDIKETAENFVLIEEVGAATTLVAELLFAMGIELDDGSAEATIGAVGILTDTKNTASATRRDTRMLSRLHERADLSRFREILGYDIPQEYFEYFALALKRKQIRAGKLVTGLGTVSKDQEGAIDFVTERLIRMAGVTLTIVWEITENEDKNKWIRVTARSSDITQRLNDYLKTLFGENSGAKFGSDMEGAGGARIILPSFLINPKTQESFSDVVQKSIEALVFGNEDQEIKTK